MLGKAAIRRAGSDLTLVTWSGQLGDCLLAAEAAQADGLSIEVIDLRTLWPWDRDTVFDSVARTGRLLVAHQAVTVGGFGAEIVAEVTEHLFAALRCPPRRLGAPRTPIPYAQPLEALCRVAPARIVSCAHQMCAQA